MNQNVPTTTPKPPSEMEATKTMKLVYEGKQLTKYIPKGQSPKLYIDLIKGQIMKPDKRGNERSNEDLLLFLYVAKRTGLDPLTRQIYAVFRWDSRQGKEVMSIQAGIDGMRLTAQRTGEYAGQDDIKFLPEDESTEFPTKATCTIYRTVGGQRVSFTASARWSEYAPVDREGKVEFMWKKMPYTMLGKCAEALALRKGFPNELSGVHSEEEMRQVAPTEQQQIANLPKPTQTPQLAEENIRVDHGAPTDNSQGTVTPENIDKYADRLMGEDSPKEAVVQANAPLQQEPKPTGDTLEVSDEYNEETPAPEPQNTNSPVQAPSVSQMRQNLRPKSVEEMQAGLKKMGEEAKEKAGVLDEGRGLDNAPVEQQSLIPPAGEENNNGQTS